MTPGMGYHVSEQNSTRHCARRVRFAFYRLMNRCWVTRCVANHRRVNCRCKQQFWNVCLRGIHGNSFVFVGIRQRQTGCQAWNGTGGNAANATERNMNRRASGGTTCASVSRQDRCHRVLLRRERNMIADGRTPARKRSGALSRNATTQERGTRQRAALNAEQAKFNDWNSMRRYLSSRVPSGTRISLNNSFFACGNRMGIRVLQIHHRVIPSARRSRCYAFSSAFFVAFSHVVAFCNPHFRCD